MSSVAGAPHSPKIESKADLAKLSLAALGVVYGDIGTSPLYAIRECFKAPHGVDVTRANVLGVESLFIWALTLVIVVKYLTFVMRADNRGEGGILALLALLKEKAEPGGRRAMAVYVALGLFGTALLYGDGVITPAISVLGATEGLASTTSFFTPPIIVTLAIVIIVALFTFQRFGTAKVGAVFGPAILLWFVAIGGLGVRWISERPDVLLALDPRHAVSFFLEHGVHGFLILGFVVLCVTGGEALSADMGHFGKTPIRVAWFAVAFPALVANYLGQGALLLAKGPVDNSFFELTSGPARYGLVAIATVAAIIASQAMISGAFSVSRQAVQLGYWPRVTIKHTSGTAEGQIYVPEVNSAMMVACVALVLAFQDSSRFASAYGIAVTGTMTATSILFYGVARRRWGWHPLVAGALVCVFLSIDLSFFGANVHKIADGGWFPLVVGIVIFTLMTTWHRGRELLGQAFRKDALPLDVFMADLATTKPHRVVGTAVFMTSNPTGVPPVLLHFFKHAKVLHEQVVILSIGTLHVPEIARSEVVEEIRDLGGGFTQVRARYGFMQTPNVLELMDVCAEKGFETRTTDTSYFLGRETLIMTEKKGMVTWRKLLFAVMSRNARPANAFFQIPPNRVVELGAQIEL
ncbi:MAG: KUP/HAK/KT family potassium transporter [Labilithrix sp.]|nr:KUP/HAK/KT family potassium transporter [Labilithrix sp.]MCW5812070.1 KUP/HAK/KT family potassium transporter [Labilithrix sp.]